METRRFSCRIAFRAARGTRREGFTLIELVGVIAVFAALSGVAVPKIIAVSQDARKTNDEKAAVGALRTLTTAQELFRDEDRDGDGIPDYAESLSTLAASGLIDPALGSGEKQGYTFSLISASGLDYTWEAAAVPAAPGKSGDLAFTVNEIGVIAVNPCPPGFEPELSPSGKIRCVKASQSVASAEDSMGIAAIDRANLLGEGQALPIAKSMAGELSALLPAAFDADGDTRLSFSELYDADLLALARQVADRLPSGPGFDTVLGDDAELDALLGRFQARLRRTLDLQPSEIELPSVPVCGLEVDLAPTFELASPHLSFAALNVLRDRIGALHTNPGAGEMTDPNAMNNARRKAALVWHVDQAGRLARSEKLERAASALERIRGRSDGSPAPEDWVAGAAASDVAAAVDDALARILAPAP
jgi:type II secretory pathway pseudopilin PulG